MSQLGRRRQERERWARRAPRTPRPASAAGRTRGQHETPLEAAPSPAPKVSMGWPRGGARRPHSPPSRHHHHRAGNPPPGPPPDPQGLSAGAARVLRASRPAPSARVRTEGRAFVTSPMASAPSPSEARGRAHPRTPLTQTQEVRGRGRPAGTHSAIRALVAATSGRLRRVSGVRFSPPRFPRAWGAQEPRDGVGGSEAPSGVSRPVSSWPLHSLNSDPRVCPTVAGRAHCAQGRRGYKIAFLLHPFLQI